MKIIGIPGSLEKLLQAIRPVAERHHLFPHNFEEIQQQGDIGHYLEKIKQIYQLQISATPYSTLLEQGIKAEYYLASELRKELYGVEGCLFNNPEIDVRDDLISGVGLTSFPDHILVTIDSFAYIETKNWNKKYLAANENCRKEEIAQQIELTWKHLVHFLREREIKAQPKVYVYDHQRTLGESIGKIKVMNNTAKIVQEMKNNLEQVGEYQKIVDEFMKMYVMRNSK